MKKGIVKPKVPRKQRHLRRTNSRRKISPQFTVMDWKRIPFDGDEDWTKAIDIFEDRVNGYMFDLIKKTTRHLNSDLAVLLLDCAVIEMLEQFRKPAPNPDTRPRRGSQATFVKFLSRSPFGYKQKLSALFYKHIRCGLAHRYEIPYPSIVVDNERSPAVALTKDKLGVIVNKRKFHDALKNAFEEYIACLRDVKNAEHDSLRNNFKSNMDWICGVANPG